MIHYPEGAIRSYRELRRCSTPVFYMVCPSSERADILKFDTCNRDRRKKSFKPKHRCYNFYREGRCVANLWTPAPHFVFGEGRFFVFANYWFAYGYMERNRPEDDRQASC